MAHSAIGGIVNERESLVHAELTRLGCTILRNGWPDFLVKTKTSKIIAVEVKRVGEIPRPDQILIHDLLKEAGIETRVIEVEPDGKGLYRTPTKEEWEVVNDFLAHCMDVGYKHSVRGCSCGGNIRLHGGWRRRIDRINKYFKHEED
jgi:hypothetical protein